MDFKDLDISYQYRSGDEEQNIVNDFYIPTLAQTKVYKRAVGYFTSASLAIVGKGLNEMISNNGKMYLIASPYLEKADIEAIESGYKARNEVIEESLLRALNQPADLVVKERLNYLAWLIANGRLEIKIATLSNSATYGLYHEKIGIMEDGKGNKIAFSGSANETEGGLYNNFESIDVFCSWNKNELIRVERKDRDFDLLWQNKTNKVQVIDFPQAAKEKLLSFKEYTIKKVDPEIQSNIVIKEDNQRCYFPDIPKEYTIRDYQKEAIKSWFENECKGLLEMATGTGKTITALSAVSFLWKALSSRLAVIIVCPYTHLVDQWVKDIKKFNMNPLVAKQSRNLWEEDLRFNISAFKNGIINHFCLITTNKTFSSKTMQDLLSQLKGEVVFVADEAHHLGAINNRMNLMEHFPYRLALSATPNRWYDEEGTEALLKYFGGKVVFEFGLKKAIGEFLTEYYYYPHVVYLDIDENEKYYEITRKLSNFYSPNGELDLKGNEGLQKLLIERARILNSARNKLIKLKELIEKNKESKYNIIYCGDSSIDNEKQVSAVVKLLGNELNMRAHTFTSNESSLQRQELLKRFELGELQALVAIKCLDEGVDVPATQNAYILASSTNPREFIQRRGRVLRKHPNKRYSYIHDFIVIPREIDEIEYLEPSVFNIERKMVKRELIRFVEFADLARNNSQAHEQLVEIKKSYNLLDI
ncbi:MULTISPECIES: DEAD/DEAH box helicase family protein [Bacillus cereus group]|uniref:DEAD/DEAH box helicase family protein n=1 Tax=Bacillus cereus group TaxID=86661 RepID=UPI001F5682D0|nr:DEAD/DEAH box helicase family protein [Bacillus cereus]MDW8781335.1 DEAD/DEAH box helicase family protein [Bacillus cereus]MDZ4561029.1 DEAD/DEAH box helicase family protein [Bacillus cereus]